MKALEIRNKTTEELEKDLLALTREQFGYRMQRSTGQLDKPHKLKAVRRDIARVKTVLHQKKVSE